MSTTHIFLTGASGYIGGSVLHALIHSTNASRYRISVLARSDDQIQRLEPLGVRGVKGSLDDLDLLKKEASEAEIVVNTASAAHARSAQVLAAGLAKRKSDGKPAHLIHTSGTSVISDAANGQFLSEMVYRDTDDLYSVVTEDGNHAFGKVNHLLVDASKQDAFGVSIVVPPTIYGPGTGLFRKATGQVPSMIRAAVRSRQVHHIGAGLPAWSNVHIEDLVSLYVLLVDAAREGRAPTGRDGYFFAETGECTWKQISERLARILHTKGLVDTPDSTPFPSIQAAADALIGGSVLHASVVFASNSRSRAMRGRALGWQPSHGNQELLATLEQQVEFVVREEKLAAQE